MASPIDQLRLQLDELEHRAEESRNPDDRRRLMLDVIALERALAAAHERLALEIQVLETIRKRVRRLRAAG